MSLLLDTTRCLALSTNPDMDGGWFRGVDSGGKRSGIQCSEALELVRFLPGFAVTIFYLFDNCVKAQVGV